MTSNSHESYPTLRVGRLMSAHVFSEVAPERVPIALTHMQGYRAVRQIRGNNEAYELELEAAINECIPRASLPFKNFSKAERQSKDVKLRPAGSRDAYGAVYDFSDIAVPGAAGIMLVRASVTVCVDDVAAQNPPPAEDTGGEPDGARRAFSKIWVRLLWLANPDSGLFDLSHLEAFKALGDSLLDSVSNRLRPLYARAVEKALEEEDSDQKRHIEIKDGSPIKVLTITVKIPEFNALFLAARQQQSLRKSLDDETHGQIAGRLVSLAATLLPCGKADSQEKGLAFVERNGERLRYLTFEDPSGYRGIYVAQFEQYALDFVGLAAAPEHEAKSQNMAGAKGEPVETYVRTASNHVSAGIGTEYAMRY